MKRTAEQVVQEWRDSGSTDWGQLVSAINYWAMTDMCPELNAGEVGVSIGALRELRERVLNYRAMAIKCVSDGAGATPQGEWTPYQGKIIAYDAVLLEIERLASERESGGGGHSGA